MPFWKRVWSSWLHFFVVLDVKPGARRFEVGGGLEGHVGYGVVRVLGYFCDLDVSPVLK